MKKKIIICFCILLFIGIIALLVLFIDGTGMRKYKSNILKNDIEIPKYSYVINELESENTYQLELIMLSKEEHIVQQLYEIYDTNENNKNINGYKFSQWSVNDKKIYKLVVIVYENN